MSSSLVPSKAMVTVPEAADLLQVHPSALYKRIREGEIPSRRIGRAVRIPTEWLRAFIDAA